MVVLVDDAEVETVVEVEEEAGVVLDHTIPLRATAVGCVATWPATVPSLLSHREVAMLSLPVEDSLNLGTKAQEDVEEMLDLIPWRATIVGCVAIWPVTIPSPVARQRVVMAPLDPWYIFQIRAYRPRSIKRTRRPCSIHGI